MMFICLMLVSLLNWALVSAIPDNEEKTNKRCKPKHMHLALGVSKNSMTISFAVPFDCGVNHRAWIKYENEDGTYIQLSLAEKRQYNSTHSGHPIYISDYYHHVTLANLNPKTRYEYQVFAMPIQEDQSLCSEESAWERLGNSGLTRYLSSALRPNVSFFSSSNIYNFTIPPPPGNKEKFKLAIVADLGQTMYSVHTIKHMAEVYGVSAVFHAGDVSYADCDLTLWDTWFEQIEILSSKVPWHLCPGNHEQEIEHNSGKVFQSYRARFQMPSVGKEIIKPLDSLDPLKKNESKCGSSAVTTQYDFGNSFHSIRIGMVKAIFLNTYTSSKPDSKQFLWLEQELKIANRTETPWLVVLMHGPFYNTFHNHHHERVTDTMKTNMEPLFLKYDVNLVIAGHVHAYSRTKPMALDKIMLNGQAPTYVIVGDGGNHGHHAAYHNPQPEPWVEVRDNTTFGFALLELVNQTHAKWKWMKNIDEGSVDIHDETYLINYHILAQV